MATELSRFGSALRRHRFAAGLTQEELAERAGLSVRGIQDLERGARRFPRPETLRRLAAALKQEPVSAAPEPLTNLPLQLTRFIGRAVELAQIRQLLDAERLLTLTGSGGVGKTRLAIEAAVQAQPAYSDGAWLIELAALAEPALLVQAVAAPLGLRPANGSSPQAALLEFLRPKRLLLVLDNCEHLVHACAELVEAMLRACPSVRLLVTSREPLRVAGEATWRVPSLSLPAETSASSRDELLDYEAVHLFVDRASASAGFELTERNATAVAQLCQRLDGIPLAIELAAARTSLLSVEQIASRLDDRFRLLVGGSRTAPARQQTLQATIDWSYELLTPSERVGLCQLAVFAGGWTIDAAEAVLAAPDVMSLLAQLVDKSLVLTEPGRDDRPRYRLLESVRDYGLSRLRENAEHGRLVQQRFVSHYCWLAEQVEANVLWGPEGVEWRGRLDPEQGNLRAALRWCLDDGEPRAALELVGHLGYFWYTRGDRAEGRSWLHQALELFPTHTNQTPGDAAWAWAMLWAGGLAHGQSEYDEAERLLVQALSAFQALDDRRGIGWALSFLGHVARARADLPRAAELLRQGADAFLGIGDELSAVSPLSALGFTVAFMGDQAEATRLLAQSVAFAKRHGSSGRLAIASIYLGQVAYAQGDTLQAGDAWREGLRLCREWDSAWGMAECLEGLALLAGAENRPGRAARLLGGAARLRESVGAPVHPVDRADHDRAVAHIRATLSGRAFEAAWAAGQALPTDELIELAVAPERTEPSAETEPISFGEEVAQLTRRELEVAVLIGRGLSDAQIAEKLAIGERAASNQVQRVLDKLGFRSRTQLAVWASELHVLVR